MNKERPESEVEAVADVHVEGVLGKAKQSRRFYVETLGLPEDPSSAQKGDEDAAEMCFVGQHHRLVLKLTKNPQIDTVKRAVLICVKSLGKARKALEEQRIEYGRLRSLGWAGERILVRDPSGNLLELRQERLL